MLLLVHEKKDGNTFLLSTDYVFHVSSDTIGRTLYPQRLESHLSFYSRDPASYPFLLVPKEFF